MKFRRALMLAQVAAVPLVLVLLVIAARDRARENTLSSFRHYRADWEDAWRAPVEHLAVDTLGRLLAHPDQDPEMAEAALSVMRRSPSWFAMGQDICSQIKGWLDVRLARSGQDGMTLKPAYELLVLAESEDADAYRARIAALGGDRSGEAAALTNAAKSLQDAVAASGGSDELRALTSTWSKLHAPAGGMRLNWLTRELPAISAAEQAAAAATASYVRALLEPYGIKAVGTYGETLPDQGMLAWLDHQAAVVNHAHPAQRERLHAARAVLAEFAPRFHFEPVVDIACATAMRYHDVPLAGVVIGLLLLIGLAGGLWFSLARLARGPMPVDVNAETMENVEPIDLDTDAETRSRSSASLTDVG